MNLLFLLQAIPESTGIIALSLVLAGVPLRWGRLLVAGTILAIIIFFIRSLPFTFGLHTVAGLLLTVLFITKSTQVPPTKSFIAVLESIIALAFLELIIHEITFGIIKLEPQQAIANKLMWALLRLPQAIFIIILALLISRFKKPEQDAWKI